MWSLAYLSDLTRMMTTTSIWTLVRAVSSLGVRNILLHWFWLGAMPCRHTSRLYCVTFVFRETDVSLRTKITQEAFGWGHIFQQPTDMIVMSYFCTGWGLRFPACVGIWEFQRHICDRYTKTVWCKYQATPVPAPPPRSLPPNLRFLRRWLPPRTEGIAPAGSGIVNDCLRIIAHITNQVEG